MAHFVSLERYIPLPEDDVEFVYAAANGTAQLGLWGFKDGNIVCTVRVISGPGIAIAKEQRGSVQVWSFRGLTTASRIQAFSGNRPFTGVLEVREVPQTATLGEQNKALLSSNNPAERAFIGSAPVPAVALMRGIGDYAYAPKMGMIRGLAVHITAGAGAANSLKNTFESRQASAHFVIDRGGDIVQYVAASIKAQAQGPGNSHFLSVEMVGIGDNSGACQEMTEAQLHKLRQLWAWVREQHTSVPNRLAWAYSGMSKGLSNTLTKLYRDMANALSDLHYCNGNSDSISACIDSWGLSCHYWLDNAAKPCPGIAIMGQLPQVLGYPRVRVTGDEKFILN
ncbi:MAG TPA: hypothetical protein DEP36_05795 [Gammaproteobacteria bacterium]|nr:hypothetical protein [Gammaproteobacteria bacterium]HRF45083.1 peptidoglycan recognition family protein [Candidatus Competibacteraceae bacterium]